jgi:hypothetical protein
MKYHVVLILFFASTALNWGCKKEKAEFTISGRIVQTCLDPLPVPRMELNLEYTGTAANFYSQKVFDLGRAITDHDGNFTITYENIKNPINNLILEGSLGQGFIELWGIPANRDLQIGDVYLNNKVMIIYKMKLNDFHTSKADTFNFTSRGFQRSLFGPFHENQIIDTMIFKPSQKYNNPLSDLHFGWRMGSRGKQIWHTSTFHLCDSIYLSFIDLNQAK